MPAMVRFLASFPEDMRQMIVPEHLSGSDEGIGQKILWGDDCFLGKRCIFGHQYAESVHGGKGEKIIAGCVDFPEYQGKVNEPMIQFFQNGSLVAADNVESTNGYCFCREWAA